MTTYTELDAYDILTDMLKEAGFTDPQLEKSHIDWDDIIDLLEQCNLVKIRRTPAEPTAETNIVREPGKDGETDFVMSGTTAWITVSNPEDPTETGVVLIKANDEGITTEIWPKNNEAESEDALCYSFWDDLNPEQELA